MWIKYITSPGPKLRDERVQLRTHAHESSQEEDMVEVLGID